MKDLQKPIAQLFIKNFEMKGCKRWRGQEGNAISANLYFQGKLYCEYLDEAYGGETEIRNINPEVDVRVKKFLEDNKVAELIFNDGYSFMKKALAIEFHTIIDVITEYVDLQEQVEKGNKRFISKIEKSMLTQIVVGNSKTWKTECKVRSWNFKRPLAGIPVEILKKHIETIKTKLADGEEILNTNLPK